MFDALQGASRTFPVIGAKPVDQGSGIAYQVFSARRKEHTVRVGTVRQDQSEEVAPFCFVQIGEISQELGFR
jgi:hypothetical protein